MLVKRSAADRAPRSTFRLIRLREILDVRVGRDQQSLLHALFSELLLGGLLFRVTELGE